MKRQPWIVVFLIVVAATLNAGAADIQVGRGEPLQPRTPGAFPPVAVNGIVPDGAEWTQLNESEATLLVTWRGTKVAAFAGLGLWMYEDGAWESLTPATPYELVVACRSIVAAFQGVGVWLFDGNTWTQLSPTDPTGIVPDGNEGFVGNFGPADGLWEFDCPAEVTCGFLDGTTWTAIDVETINTCDVEGPQAAGFVLLFRLDGALAWTTAFEDSICEEEDESPILLTRECTTTAPFNDVEDLGGGCFRTSAGVDWAEFDETGGTVGYVETETLSGTNCPPGPTTCEIRGSITLLPCDREICWAPCDEPAAALAVGDKTGTSVLGRRLGRLGSVQAP